MNDKHIVVILTTKPCPRCGNADELLVNGSDYEKYMAGMRVQDAFPTLSAGRREQILTGYHPECWDIDIKEDEE